MITPRRLLSLLITLLAPALIALSMPIEASAGPAPKRAPKTDVVDVGVVLVAKGPIRLREAQLRKGTKVRVVHVERDEAGKLKSLSLELPDGYVLNEVSPRTVSRHFIPAKQNAPGKAKKRK